jgi:hypothetical protein
VYNQLNGNASAIWSLLLASGYLKVVACYEVIDGLNSEWVYELAITNHETRCMFVDMIKGWFGAVSYEYSEFVKAMLLDDVDMMNLCMNKLIFSCFSYFDTGAGRYQEEPERFYHGFVLGLLVDLRGRFIVTSNRESGFGRYDIMLEPVKPENDDAIIIEFKVFNPRKEKSMEETLVAAHSQIEEKSYEASLIAKGISKENIRKYGFVFEGKKVLVG